MDLHVDKAAKSKAVSAEIRGEALSRVHVPLDPLRELLAHREALRLAGL